MTAFDHRISGIFLCVFAALLPACSKRVAAPADTSILRISQRNEPATLDPQLATLPDEFFIIRALSEGLVTPNPAGGQPLPAAAQSWEISADGLTYTFHLRPDAKWSNGDPVTADDFVFTIHRALDPATAAPKASLFSIVAHANATSAHTLVITLRHPAPDFLALAASGPWIPVNPRLVQASPTGWTRPGSFVGNGPFTLAEWSPNQRIVVRKNPGYWNAAAFDLAEIHCLAFDHGDTEERAFRAGQVDVTLSVPATKLDGYRAAQPAVLHTVPLHETRFLSLNTTRPPLNDVRVRRALSLALDRRSLTDKVLKGGQQPAFTLIPPGLGGYQPAATPAENPAEARQLLAEAGFPGGRGFPRLELSTWGASTAVLEAIQQCWHRELGLDVALAPREARTHLAALAAGDYDLGFVTAIPDYDSPADLLGHFTGDSPNNYPHWRNAAYDRIVSGMRDAAAYHQAEQLILTEVPLIPLYFNTKNFLLRPTVTGWQEDALWTRYYQHVSLHE